MSRQPPVIVVAEDDGAIRAFIHDLLDDEGYQVLCFTSGADALQAIHRRTPDLALLDMRLEAQDTGLRVLAQLRQQPETARVAVVVYSADRSFLEAKRDDITALGGAIVHKPFDTQILLATIERLLLASP